MEAQLRILTPGWLPPDGFDLDPTDPQEEVGVPVDPDQRNLS